MSFHSLGLRADLLRTVASRGYEDATDIQVEAIPPILEGRDLLGGSQTGTGKTAAFTLPLLQRLSAEPHAKGGRNRGRLPRALILTPTRELAAQVEASVSDYGEGLGLSSTAIFGGVGMNPQIRALRHGVDILVATPGRLLDHARQGNVDLSAVGIFVLDEADRMLDMGFIHDIRRIMKLLPPQRQNLLFSATYSKEIEALADGLLDEPVYVEVARRNTAAEKVAQVVHPVAKSDKRTLLSHLIRERDWSQVLVFTRTKQGANRLAKQLEQDGIRTDAIHGNKTQAARTRALASFKSGHIRVLAATDVASRGLDISRLPHVVNYELPNVPEDYVHRIGRTGRAGEEGTAYSLVSADERAYLRAIEKLLERDIPVEDIEGFRTDPGDRQEKPSGRGRNRSRNANGNANGNGNRSGGRNRNGGDDRSGPRGGGRNRSRNRNRSRVRS